MKYIERAKQNKETEEEVKGGTRSERRGSSMTEQEQKNHLFAKRGKGKVSENGQLV
jgi:hypothetical protein